MSCVPDASRGSGADVDARGGVRGGSRCTSSEAPPARRIVSAAREAARDVGVPVRPGPPERRAGRAARGQPRGQARGVGRPRTPSPGAEVLAGLRPGATAGCALRRRAARETASRVREPPRRRTRSRRATSSRFRPGCVHAPGPGLVLYEVQQPVDLTYRIFDWGRLGLDGKPRPLHVDKARAGPRSGRAPERSSRAPSAPPARRPSRGARSSRRGRSRSSAGA